MRTARTRIVDHPPALREVANRTSEDQGREGRGYDEKPVQWPTSAVRWRYHLAVKARARSVDTGGLNPVNLSSRDASTVSDPVSLSTAAVVSGTLTSLPSASPILP